MKLPPWGHDQLPEPPDTARRRLVNLIGPGLVMVGANIGGGEWLFGPLVTGQYGGQVLWLATLAIVRRSTLPHRQTFVVRAPSSPRARVSAHPLRHRPHSRRFAESLPTARETSSVRH